MAANTHALEPGRIARFTWSSRSVLAASGFVLLGYVLVHMCGNLLAFAGSATFDGYSRWLREVGAPVVGTGVLLWTARVVLLAALVAHLAAHAWMLFHPEPAGSASGWRPAPPAYVANAFAIPLLSGAVIMLFLLFHLAQLTFGATLPAFDPASPYRNLVGALRSWPVAIGYVLAAFAVGAHLLPGLWSGARSLGLISPRSERGARVFAPLLAVVIVLGLSSVPIAALLGIIG